MKSFFKTEKNIYSIVLVLAVVVFVLLNIFAASSSQNFSLRMDTTETGLYELSETTRLVCDTIGDTQIYVIAARSEYPKMFSELLRSYESLTDRITVSYIDPYSDPVFLEQRQQQGIALEENDILVSGTFGEKKIGYTDMLVYSGENVTGICAEQQLSSALSYVNSEVHRRVLFTTGHNERPTASLTAVFTDSGCTVETAATDSYEADLVVIAAPTRDFSTDEVKSLSEYLNKGGRVLALFEPGTNGLENLWALLAKWNISLMDNLIMDADYSVASNPLNIIPAYTTHEINSFFEDNRYFVVSPSTRAVEILTNSADTEALPLLISSPTAYAKTVSAFRTMQMEQGDEQGAYYLAVISEKDAVSKEGENTSAMLTVLGSRYICGDDVMGTASYANRDFFAQLAKYMLGNDTALSIPPKTLEAQPLVITAAQTKLCTAIFIIAIPVLVLALGIAVFLKRRKL